MLKPAHLLPLEEKEYWYNEAKKCQEIPADQYDDIRYAAEASYDIGEVGDWVVYRQAWDQADSWNEQHYEDNITHLVVLCGRTYFILVKNTPYYNRMKRLAAKA
jgi:hypothetical protein